MFMLSVQCKVIIAKGAAQYTVQETKPIVSYKK